MQRALNDFLTCGAATGMRGQLARDSSCAAGKSGASSSGSLHVNTPSNDADMRGELNAGLLSAGLGAAVETVEELSAGLAVRELNPGGGRNVRKELQTIIGSCKLMTFIGSCEWKGRPAAIVKPLEAIG